MKSTGGRYWLAWGALLWTGRALLLMWLYFTPAPGGGPMVDDWTRFLPHSLVAEAGVAATLTLVFLLLDRALGGRARRTLPVCATIIGILYLVAAHFDAELMRWMSQHLSVSWMFIYLGRGMDASFTARILGGAATAFFAGFAITACVSLLLVLWTRRARFHDRPGVWPFIILFAIAVAGLTSKEWFGPSSMRWRRIQPVAWGLAGDLMYRGAHALRPHGYDAAVRWLAQSGNPSARPQPGKYPFWKPEPREDSLMAAFRARPSSQRPDVYVLWIESLRGWTADVRDPAACAHLPNLCALAKEGAFFPHMNSTGFPSIEGFSGLHLGVWSHPDGVLLSDRAAIKMRSLPDILGKAGYYRAALTASEPSFDNLTPWFDKWYDFWEYNPDRDNDQALADRFATLLTQVPSDRPLFALWMSTTTHMPFTLPPGHGPDPDDIAARYQRALAYADSAIGITLDAIHKGPRRRPAIIIVAGDHSFPNRPFRASLDEDGSPSLGQTWTALWMQGPGIPRGEVRARPVSQVDIAPTILSLLRLRAANHFMGVSLLASPSPGDSAGATACAAGPRVLAFRLGGMAAQRGACRYALRLDDREFLRVFRQDLYPAPLVDRVDGCLGAARSDLDDSARAELEAMRRAGEAWRWTLDHDRLMP